MRNFLFFLYKLANHGRLPAVFVLMGLIAAGLPLRSASASATPQADFWIANGPVYSSVLNGATLYIGGDFTYVGPETGAGVTFDTTTGAPNAFPRIDGRVDAVASDGAGGWYVGGIFTDVDGSSTYNNLAHIIPNPSDSTQMIVDTGFKPVISVSAGQVSVNALLVSGTTLYVGGNFDTIDDGKGAVIRNNIAAFTTNNGLLATTWNPDADGKVSTLVLSSDGLSVYAGGAFANIGGAARNGVAALNADATTAGAATTWDAAADPGTIVNVLLVDPGTGQLYMGGAFSKVGGQTRNNLAEVSGADGSLVTAWDPNANAAVYALILSTDGTAIFVGGAFNTSILGTPAINGKSREYLAKVDTSTGAGDDSWHPAANGTVLTMTAVGLNSLMVGGDFTDIDGNKRLYIANIGFTSGVVTTLDPSSESTVRVLKQVGSGTSPVFAGGDFISLGGKDRDSLAALDTATGQATAWNPDVNGIVRTIAPSITAIYIGGDFSAVGGRARNHLAAIDPVTALTVAGWDISVDQPVNALLLSGTTLYMGGAFAHVGTTARKGLASVSTDTVALTSWAPTVVNGAVNAMALFNDEAPVLYVGGTFTSINNKTRNRLAALDGTTGALTAWDPNVDIAGTNGVLALALSTVTDDDVTDTNDTADVPPILYVGGDFTHIDGAALNYLAAVKTDAAATLVSWDAGANMADAPVRALALAPDNALLYAGGDFTAVGDQSSRVALSALTADNGDATAWDPVPSATGTVRALALTPSGTLYAGGDFTRISGVLRNRLAAFEPPTAKATPGAGAYNAGQNVVLSCIDKTGADCTDNILYSTDGSVPGIAYTSGVQIAINTPATTTTLKFYAADSEGMREGIKTNTYIIDESPPTVSASPKGGTYTAAQNIILTCVDANDQATGGSGCVSIYYTTDGTTPTKASTLYTSAFSLDNNTDLKFIAYDGAGNASPVMEEQYTIDAFPPVTTPTPPPLVSPASYTVPQLVTLTCDDKGGFGCAGTYYTTDGSTPTTASTLYTQPILIDHNTSLNYFSVDKAGHAEVVTSAVYIIQTGIVVTSGGGLLLPPLYLLGAWGLFLGRIGYLRRRRP